MNKEAKLAKIEVGEVVGEVFAIYKKHLKVLAFFAALCYVMPILLSIPLGDSALGSLLGSIIQLLGALVFVGFIVLVVREHLSGDGISIIENIKEVLPKLGNLFVSSIVKTIAIILGLIVFIVPGIYLAIRFAMSEAAIINEDVGPIEALKRSGEMTESIKWRIFFIAVIFVLIVFAITFVLLLTLGFIAAILFSIGGAIGIVIGGIALLVLFLALVAIQPLGALWAPVIYFRIADSDKQ